LQIKSVDIKNLSLKFVQVETTSE